MTVTVHKNTAHLDATGQAFTGSGKVECVNVWTDTATGVGFKLYDGVATVTKPMTPPLAVDPAVDGGEVRRSKSFKLGVEFDTGVYCTITGTGECTVVLGK